MSLTRRIRRQLQRRRLLAKKQRKVHLEPLEPRILLSTETLSSSTAAAVDLTLGPRVIDSTETFRLINDIDALDPTISTLLFSTDDSSPGLPHNDDRSDPEVDDRDLAERQLVVVDPSVPDSDILLQTRCMKGFWYLPSAMSPLLRLQILVLRSRLSLTWLLTMKSFFEIILINERKIDSHFSTSPNFKSYTVLAEGNYTT